MAAKVQSLVQLARQGFTSSSAVLPHSLAMPVIPVDSQIFDLAFHPSSDVVYTGLLNGKVKAFTYDEQGAHSPAFDLRISKRSCRGLALSPDGSSLYAVGKNKSLQLRHYQPNAMRNVNVRLVKYH
jgi:WD40 repeat protein